jgi:hypothetical protein
VSDLDDLIGKILKPPKQPQLKKAGVASSTQHPAEEPLDLTYKVVTPRKTLPTCVACLCKLKAGKQHWYYHDNSSLYWWCVSCMRRQCGLYPPKERQRVKSNP